jgi:predicted nucleic acid-binding protein
MYLIGAPHPHKTDAQRLLEQLISRQERLVTDAEVFQEILHRYVAIRRRDAIQPAFDALNGVIDEVFPIEKRDLDRAKDIVLGSAKISARDAIHIAIIDRYRIDAILSFDRGFDEYPGLKRVSV